MVVKTNPEFGIELALTIPYAYYLHTQNKLKTVITSKGMKPFYYFCNDVREEFTHRTVDNGLAGLNTLPNPWIHHNALKVFGKDYSLLNKEEQHKANGVLDYSEWKCPPYAEYYKNNKFNFGKPIIFITNKYNIEHGEEPFGYFDIKCLYDIFSYLTEKGYAIIYKRATNKEGFAIDQNEQNTLLSNLEGIKANVEGFGVINDHQLTEFFDDVYLIDNLIKEDYNKTQLQIMANAEGFISVCGGNSVLSSCFGKTVISYIHKGKELRPEYFSENSYFKKLSNANVIPIFDVIASINNLDLVKEYGYDINYTNKNDYSKLIKTIKQEF